MASLVAQLKFFELVLLGCGVVFFMVITILLIIRSSQGKSLTPLLAFFMIPITMIGFPSIQSIKISKDQVEIAKKTEEVEKNPSDTVATKELEELLRNIDFTRARRSADALTSIARAHSALGNYDTALAIVDKAINLDEGSSEAQELKSVVEERRAEKQNFESNIARLREIIGTNGNVSAGDAEAVSDILSTMKAPVYIDKQSALTLAKAFAVVNERDKALKEVAKVTEIQPQHPAAITLQRQLAVDSAQTTPALTPEDRRSLRNSEIYRASRNKLVIRR